MAIERIESPLTASQKPDLDRDVLRFSLLASGSSGNATYIESNQQKILVDAGLSGKKITELMASIGRNPKDLDALLVTHEHRDHVHGIGVLSRRYNLPIYANKATWKAMDAVIGQIHPDNRRYIEVEKLLTLGDIDIMPFAVSHDAIDPQFYTFSKNHHEFAMITDTGYISSRLASIVENCSAYLIESNHDIEMLRYGAYPWSLKQRILSDVGHLSNEDCGLALVDLIGPKTKNIYLGHLSEENNMKALALETVSGVLADHDLGVGQDFQLHMTHPDQATPLQDLW